jgi:hypothetical protein
MKLSRVMSGFLLVRCDHYRMRRGAYASIGSATVFSMPTIIMAWKKFSVINVLEIADDAPSLLARIPSWQWIE